jgi:hypothetical protein
MPKIDRELLKEIAGEIAKEISGDLKKEVKKIEEQINPVRELALKDGIFSNGIKIKTDFDFPIEDKSLILESNIDKIGANLEKEKFNIDKSVKLLKEMQKTGKKR